MTTQEALSPEERDALDTVLQIVRTAAASELAPFMVNHVDGFLTALAAVDPPLRVAALREAPSAPGLDEAWAAVEAALPDGWTGPFVGPHVDGDFWANAWLTAGGRPTAQSRGTDNLIIASQSGHGPTPADALLALAAALAPSPDTEARDGPTTRTRSTGGTVR